MRELDLNEIELVTGGEIVITSPTLPTLDYVPSPYGGDREPPVSK